MGGSEATLAFPKKQEPTEGDKILASLLSHSSAIPPIEALLASVDEHLQRPPTPPPPIRTVVDSRPSSHTSSPPRSPEANSQPANHGTTRLEDIEVPFTDSGYASAPPAGSKQGPAQAGNDDDDDDCDSRTIISTATTVVPYVAQNSITEVCNNIYNKIYRHIDEHNMDSFFETLPDFIKIFALRFAHLNSSNTNRQIMHFVYSRHR